MLVLRTGNIFGSGCQAFINPVNCKGIIGPGIAKQFNLLYPEIYPGYYEACKNNLVYPGSILPTKTVHQIPKWILNFAIKEDWRKPSNLNWIEKGLENLVNVSKSLHLELVAFPALNWEKENLSWPDVYRLMYKHLSLPEVKYFIYIEK